MFMFPNPMSDFKSLSEYRQNMVESMRVIYARHGHLFAPLPTMSEQEQQRRHLLDSYMRQLVMLPFGAAILQIEVQGQHDIYQAMVDGTLYSAGGVWAKRVQTETFSFYTADLEAEGEKEWLSFFKDETYVSRSGQIRQKLNQKALNLAFKKPIEAEVVNEVDTRFQRWYQPTVDLFRRHWETRETIEGRMVMALYFEYATNVQKVFQQYPGEENEQSRVEKIDSLMDQYLLDTEEVRQTAKDRAYSDGQIIEAVRRAVHNFCVEQNRRLVSLLRDKRTVSMFLEGGSGPEVVYHTVKDPRNDRSAFLSSAEMVAMAARSFLRLAQNDIQRSKLRMDAKASTTYAPVKHAETRQAREAVQQAEAELEQQEPQDESRAENLPFGLSFGAEPGPDSEVDEDLSHLNILDALASEGEHQQWIGETDLKRLPYAIGCLEGSLIRTVERFASIQEAIGTMHSSLAQLDDPAQAEVMRSRTKLIHDPKAHLGAGGSTRLLRTLEQELTDQVKNQGDRYWHLWAIVQLKTGLDGAKIATVTERFASLTKAALALQSTLHQKKQALQAQSFKAEAAALKLVQDPEGSLPEAGLSKLLEALPEGIAAQVEAAHYEVKRGEVVIRLDHLNCDPTEIEQANTALGSAMTARLRQAKALIEAEQPAPDTAALQSIGF